MPTSGAASDAARRLVVERDLVRAAFGHLTLDAFMTLPFEALGPTKALLKRFFSLQPWAPEDDGALAAAVGPGVGSWRRALDPELALEYGWTDGRFQVRITSTATASAPTAREAGPTVSLADTFDGPVVPEATPNPRTIRFQVGPIHSGPSHWYESAKAAADDPSASRLFAAHDEVANVLVGPDFVAVGLRRPGDWERLLRPVLDLVAEEFSSPDNGGDTGPPRVMGGPAGAGAVGVAGAAGEGGEGGGGGGRAGGGPVPPGSPRLSRLEQAWLDMGALRPADPADLAEVRAAAAGADPSRRQVAASLLREADEGAAAEDWNRLATDRVRSVRRATVDAVVDVGRQELRPLLEAALADGDAWIRWKALRGLAELGPGPSRDAIAARAEDADFRVRLEAAAALRAVGE